MKTRIFLLMAILSFASAGFTQAQTKKTTAAKKNASKPKSNKPAAKEVIRVLLSNGTVNLSSYESCKSVIAQTKDNTVFDYLSEILSYETEPESATAIDFQITSKKGKNGETLWVCYLMFQGKLPPNVAGEDFSDVWSMGFRFEMRDSNRKMVRSTLECLAAG